MAIHRPLVSELLEFTADRHATPTGAEQTWEAHLHSFHQFDATLAGQSTLTLGDGRVLAAKPGCGILIPPLVRHAHGTRTGFTVGMFKFHLAPQGWAALGGDPVVLTLSDAALAAVAAAGQARQKQAFWQEEQAVAALTGCLIEAARQVAGARATGASGPVGPANAGPGAAEGVRQVLWPVLEAIEADPFAAWPVSALAARCHWTADHFTKRFQAMFGCGPQQYVFRARMRQAAAALVSDPPVSIKALAIRAGYASVHGFARAFKQATGISPARFRREPGEL